MQEIEEGALLQTLEKMKKEFDYLKKITAVDYNSYFEVVYILFNTETKKQEVVKIKLPHDNPEVETITGLYPAADWYEREIYEMFGIKINGREVKRLLLEKWNGETPPLLKSFEWGKNYKKLG
ncbi:MAG: NADH-quinone oxidoreductase subunit C [Candidatus Micrarchaeaceae archaeon]